MVQVLTGIEVEINGSYNIGRWGKKWVGSSAFNGYIYSSSSSIGYSNAPNELTLSIVLEAKGRLQTNAVFDINKNDLRCDAGTGADENTFDINLNGVWFRNYVLYSYEISIESNAKILTVTLKDYSVILDKIYVGLIKRQGNLYTHSSLSTVEFPVNCPDCLLQGDSFTTLGTAYRNIDYGSYVGINGKTHDNFSNLIGLGSIHNHWQNLFNAGTSSIKFDLNGGYLILGTEGVSEEKCGNLAGIFYNFNQLLASLRFRGLNFIGEFPKASQDFDYVYKQNYIGTLREVLQQWCSDLGYDFYCEGKNFVGINTNRALDIEKITQICDPTTELGNEFSLTKGAVITSYKESNTIGNSYKQSVITANNRPRETKTHTKSPKRYVGLLPLHPIDFNRPSLTNITRRDIFGIGFPDISYVNSFLPTSSDLNKTLYQLDNRPFSDVDNSIALSHYDNDLRDIYCQQQALYGATSGIRAANFKSLGMVPLIEVTGIEKSTAIEKAFGSNDEVSNICLDSRFYKVYIGYYYDKFKQDVVQWEQNAADNMYRFGAVTQGILNGVPYVPNDYLDDAMPFEGLYGAYGRSITRITHSFEPAAEQYYDLYKAPFKDLLLYSGLRNSGDYFNLDLKIGQISNDWGTTNEQFKRDLSLKLDDACVTEFQNAFSYADIQKGDIVKKYQDWKLNLFKPIALPDLQDFFYDFNGQFAKISGQGQLDRISQVYYDTNYKKSNTCAKLHILILADTQNHPNINISFTKRGREFVNPVVLGKYLENQREALKRLAYTKTPSECDISLLQEMCENLTRSKALVSPSNNKYTCALQDQYNAFEEGFDVSYLNSKNSRGLSIGITKNPIRNTDNVKLQNLFKNSDANGAIYYVDAVERFLKHDQQQANLDIIYPISVEATDDIYYKGILTSEVSVETRSPETVEMFGEPPNSENNITAGCKVINNIVESDLQPALDPYSSKFVTYLTVVTGDHQVLTTPSGYHNIIKNLNNYSVTGAAKTVSLSLAGSPEFWGSFADFVNPSYGLTKFSMTLGDKGLISNLEFADRSPTPPKQENILNKISARIV